MRIGGSRTGPWCFPFKNCIERAKGWPQIRLFSFLGCDEDQNEYYSCTFDIHYAQFNLTIKMCAVHFAWHHDKVIYIHSLNWELDISRLMQNMGILDIWKWQIHKIPCLHAGPSPAGAPVSSSPGQSVAGAPAPSPAHSAGATLKAASIVLLLTITAALLCNHLWEVHLRGIPLEWDYRHFVPVVYPLLCYISLSLVWFPSDLIGTKFLGSAKNSYCFLKRNNDNYRIWSVESYA